MNEGTEVLTKRAVLLCEGTCVTTAVVGGVGQSIAPAPTPHSFSEKEPVRMQLRDGKAGDIVAYKWLYACGYCGARRTWGFESA